MGTHGVPLHSLKASRSRGILSGRKVRELQYSVGDMQSLVKKDGRWKTGWT